jgi:hypothetical protein
MTINNDNSLQLFNCHFTHGLFSGVEQLDNMGVYCYSDARRLREDNHLWLEDDQNRWYSTLAPLWRKLLNI